MKMLVSQSPLARQAPTSIYHAVSIGNGGWFKNNFVVGNKSNGNGIKVIADDEMKHFVNNVHRSSWQPCPVIHATSFGTEPKQEPSVTFSNHTHSNETLLSNSIVQPSDNKKRVATLAFKQQCLENRTQVCLKRLKTLRSTTTRRTLYKDLKSLLTVYSSKKDDAKKDTASESVQASPVGSDSHTNSQDVGGEHVIKKGSFSSEFFQSTCEALSQMAFDIERLYPEICGDDETDVEDNDDYIDAVPLTEGSRFAPNPVSLASNSESVLENTPAWRYEAERLSLAARESFLRSQITELDAKCRQLSERSHMVFSKPRNTSSQNDPSFTHACSSYSAARTRPYDSKSSRRRTFYKVNSATTETALSCSPYKLALSNFSNKCNPTVMSATDAARSSFSSALAAAAEKMFSNVCHCSCQAIAPSEVSYTASSCQSSLPYPTTSSSVSCLTCQGKQAAWQLGHDQVVASQPDVDPESRLTQVDSSFHPQLSKLAGFGALTGTTRFERLDNAAACLLDHAYSAESIFAKPKGQSVKTTSPNGSSTGAIAESGKTFSAIMPPTKAADASTLLPPIPLPIHAEKAAKLSSHGHFVNSSSSTSSSHSSETPSRLRVRKPSPNSSTSVLSRSDGLSSISAGNILHSGKCSQNGDESLGGRKKRLLQKQLRLEQRKRLQLQRRKEQQRRNQQQQQQQKEKGNVSSLSVSARRPSISAVASLPPPSSLPLSASLPNASVGLGNSSASSVGSLPFPQTATPAVGSGGFDIDNVVIPPPTPTALLAAAQALAESSNVEIATPGFRRLAVEQYKPPPRSVGFSKGKQSRLSLSLSVSTKDYVSNGATTLSETTTIASTLSSHLPSEAVTTATTNNSSNTSNNIDDAPFRLQLSSPNSTSASEVFVQSAFVMFEDTDDVVYRRRHHPLEQLERARYLAIQQLTVAPRKTRDAAVNARPPSQNGKRGLSRSYDEGLRRSTRVSSASSAGNGLVADPECKPFVFPLSAIEWQHICAEKEALAQLKQE